MLAIILLFYCFGPAWQVKLSPQCVENQYYDITNLACESCPNTLNQANLSQLKCICKTGFVPNFSLLGFRQNTYCE